MLTHKGTLELRTERLVLRRFTVEDAQAMFSNWATDELTTKYLSWAPHSSVDETRGILESWVQAYDSPNCYNWVIEYNGEITGNVAVHGMNEKHCRCELGYCSGSRFWNKGIMSEAVRAVIGFLFKEVGMHRVVAQHDPSNPASGRVMEKCGMTLEGQLRHQVRYRNGEYADLVCYGILEDEYR